MSALAIYFGPREISIVETKGKSLVNHIQIPQATINAGELELEEKVPFEVKIVAIFKDELRRAKMEAKEAALCLSGADLIIRTFELPLLPREEMQTAVNFEAKKYIPFRLEELIFDFQIEFDKINRKNLVLFTGIKKETLQKYVSILSQLNIKITGIEYSAFGLLRTIKLAGLPDKGVIGLMGADLLEADEINFVVAENGFPLFSRDISLAGGPEDLANLQAQEPGMLLEKLKTEIRVSLDYYHRKFPTKNIQKLFFLSNLDYRSDLEAFMTEIGITSQFVELTKAIGTAVPFSLGLIKGYSSSLSKIIKANIKVNLLAAKEKAGILKEKAIKPEAVSLVEGLKLDPRIAILGLFICIATFGFGIYRLSPVRRELNNVIALRPQVATVNPQANYAELTVINSEYKKKLEALDALIKKQLYLTTPLDVIPRAMPKGVWLKRFSFNKREADKAELVLEGMAYLADSSKEFEAVNQLLAGLKANPNFNKYFKDISITSLDRGQLLEKLTVTNFSISGKTYKGRD